MRTPWNISKEKAVGMFTTPNGIRWIVSGQQPLLDALLGQSLRVHDRRIENEN